MAAGRKPPPTNVAHLLLGVLGVVPPELRPQPPFHGGGPQPKVGAYGYLVGGLWLADRARPHVDPRDREVFERWVTLAREQLAAGPEDDTRRKQLMKADAKKDSRIPCKIVIWSAHEASNWAWRGIYADGAARPAFANWARYLLKKSPADVRAFVADVHALCIHLEALSLLREREQQTTTPVVATPWRGHEGMSLLASSCDEGARRGRGEISEHDWSSWCSRIVLAVLADLGSGESIVGAAGLERRLRRGAVASRARRATVKPR